jgi:OOP family OmpA-OmpF porin
LITTFEPVRFKTNSAEIEPSSHAMLSEIANVMKANPGMEIHVAGHADAQGDEEYNLELSEQRSQSVRTFIISQGVEDGRIDAKGYGEELPVADNETRRGRRVNRRVEFHIKGREE